MYDDSAPNPKPALIDDYDPMDDFELVPQDGLELFKDVDYSFKLEVQMIDLGDGAN